ncbi:MAG: hydrogenase nickel incorporation protein HypB [Candidatus Nanopelagicales bacterium]
MHEASIAHAVVSTVVDALDGDPPPDVRSVRLCIGELAAVVPAALMFAYDVATAGTPLEGSTLDIETTPAIIECPRCGRGELADFRDFRCPTCGDLCGKVVGGQELEIVQITLVGQEDESADDGGDSGDGRIEEIRTGMLAKNDFLAAGLRGRFTSSNVRVSNWVSSPGSGKTALLEALLAMAVERGLGAATLVGDCATDNDAVRLARSGAIARQIVTDGNCHLESDMISAHLEGWDLDDFDLLVIENVGNLVCPASYDLGEDTRVVLLSVTEGEDKPLKYPKLFITADVVVVTKLDVVEAVGWDREAALDAVRAVNPEAQILLTSARRGEGVEDLLDQLLAPVGSVSAASVSAATC